jgi:hypothetical protein
MVEQRPFKALVPGSSPGRPTTVWLGFTSCAALAGIISVRPITLRAASWSTSAVAITQRIELGVRSSLSRRTRAWRSWSCSLAVKEQPRNLSGLVPGSSPGRPTIAAACLRGTFVRSPYGRRYRRMERVEAATLSINCIHSWPYVLKTVNKSRSEFFGRSNRKIDKPASLADSQSRFGSSPT